VDRGGETLWTGTGMSGGVLSARFDVLDRVRMRAGGHALDSSVGYTDRHGMRHTSFDSAVRLAQALAAEEPQTMLIHVEAEERQDEIQARESWWDPGLIGAVERRVRPGPWPVTGQPSTLNVRRERHPRVGPFVGRRGPAQASPTGA
jgi:hypothetical protein